jgi:hypothetical protein
VAVTEKLAEKGLELLETAGQLGAQQAPILLKQFLDYMIFITTLDIVSKMVFLLIPLVITRHITSLITLSKQSKKDSQGHLKDLLSSESHTGPYKYENRDVLVDAKKRVIDESFRLTNLHIVRSLVVIIPALIIGFNSIDSIKNLGKIVIAPNYFILEEGAKLLKK